MSRSRDDLERLADDTERDLERLDPSTIAEADRVEDLRAIRGLVDEIADTQRRLTAAVVEARRHGRSWGDIALVLGVTRQSAHAKYAQADVEGWAAPEARHA